MTGPRLLLVEDDVDTRKSLAGNLRAHGYGVVEAGTADGALREWTSSRPDLLLLDLGLPDKDGLVVVRHVRREATTPILILSARTEERDRVEALEQGADDYLTKPFGLRELQARVIALLRRSGGGSADIGGTLMLGPLALDPVRRRVTIRDRPLSLTPREFELLRVLITNRGRVVTRARLLRSVWGTEYATESHYLHVYVSRLRRKLEDADPDAAASRLIIAEPGIGYRVADE